MVPKRPSTRLDFEIAIICALPIEADAVRGLFDHDWEAEGPPYDKVQGDPNAYSTGLLGRHNVVLAHMPGMGKANAAIVAANCRISFPNIKLAIIVGVCGAVPFVPGTDDEIILGDVIISHGIIQYDFGRQFPDHFARKTDLLDSLGRPNTELRALFAKLDSISHRKKLTHSLVSHLEELQRQPDLDAEYPGLEHDNLFISKYRHIENGSTCEECGCNGELVKRRRLGQGIPQPAVYFGLVASGDTVMKDGEERDKIAREEGVIGFEMEAAGIWDNFSCIVIKGACDYADSHKSKSWQRYAAGTAAACAKSFLEYWVPAEASSVLENRTGTAWNLPANCSNIGYIRLEYSLPFSLSEAPEVGELIGRKEELLEMHGILQPADSRRAVVLHGLGGIGKTHLAIAYLKKYHTNYSAILWLNARDESSLQESFVRVAKTLHDQFPASEAIKTASDSQQPKDAVQAVKNWLDEVENTRWLLVFDNYDHPKLEGNPNDIFKERASSKFDTQLAQDAAPPLKPFDIRTYFPRTYQGAIVITTRLSTVRIGKSIPLKKFTQIQDSLDLLYSSSQRDDIRNGSAAIKLAERLDGLPLALASAGAYLSQVTTSCETYLELHYDSWRRLQQNTPNVYSYENGALYSTWNISYNQIKQINKEAAMLLHLWAYLDNKDLWYELFACVREESFPLPLWFENMVQDQISFDQVMRILCNHGLVEAHQKQHSFGSKGYSVHGCVHAWMRFVLTEEQNIDLVVLAGNCVATYFFNIIVKTRGSGEVSRRLLLHTEICSVQAIKSWGEINGAQWTMLGFGSLFMIEGLHREAEIILHQALRGHDWIPEKSKAHQTLQDLGNLYMSPETYREPEVLLGRTLQIYDSKQGLEVLLALQIAEILGTVYLAQSRNFEGETLLKQVLQSKERIFGSECPLAVTTRATLLTHEIEHDPNRFTQGEALYNQFLQSEEAQEQKRVDALGILSRLYIKPGRYREAEAILNRALKRNEKVLGPENGTTLNVVHGLGLLCKAEARFDEAEVRLNRVLQGREKVLGPEDPKTLEITREIGVVYLEQGRYSEAKRIFHRTLQGVEKALGPEDPSTMDVVYDLSVACIKQAQSTELNTICQGMTKVWEPKYVSKHGTIFSLRYIILDPACYDQAEALFNQLLRYEEKIRGPEDLSILAKVSSLGEIYLSQGRYTEAETMFDRVLQSKDENPGPSYTWSIIEAAYGLARTYLIQGFYSKAETFFKRLIREDENAWGTCANRERCGSKWGIEVVTAYQNLGFLCYLDNRQEEAEAYFVLATSTYKSIVKETDMNNQGLLPLLVVKASIKGSLEYFILDLYHIGVLKAMAESQDFDKSQGLIRIR